MAHQTTEKSAPVESKGRISVKWLWRFFSSVRLAIILILIIAGLSLIGALTTFDIFNSIYFAVPGVMLMLNILVCSLNRWKSISLSLRGGEIIKPEDFYQSGIEVKEIKAAPAETGAIVEGVLVRHGYRVRKSGGENIHFAADKNRFFRLGTYLSHFSLILFVGAFILGFHYGFHDNGFAVAEGETRQVGHNTNLSLKLVSFTYQQYDNGMPEDYSSRVVLYQDGQPVRDALIRVNHPLYYQGIRFYQSFFGSAVKIQIKDGTGQTVFAGGIAMSAMPGDATHYDGYIDLPAQALTIQVIISSAANDPMIPAGSAAIGIIQQNQQINLKLVQQDTPTTINGLEFNFQGLSTYSGFQVSRDPTNAIIWIASVLFIAGICGVFYFPYRQSWVACIPEDNRCRLLFQTAARPGAAAELDILITEIKKRLPAEKP